MEISPAYSEPIKLDGQLINYKNRNYNHKKAKPKDLAFLFFKCSLLTHRHG